MGVRLLVGTAKGGFMAGVASDIYGPGIFLSGDGEEWEQVADGPAYPDGDDRRLRQVWTLRENRGTVYAGVQDAGLFTSGDGGRSWEPVPGLNDHETRSGWMPGAGGLCCHAVLFDHKNPDRVWCGISAVGVFRTDDGGTTWIPRNRGVYWAHEDEEFKEIGHCVHGMAQVGQVKPTVTVHLPSLLEPVTGGVRELTASGGSLREVLDDLVAREPRLKPHLFNEVGELRRHVLCFHNGTNTRWMNGWDAPMSDGDTILFMQAVSGG